ncbi:hypothetical protein [uncultured Mediterranean phage uvMED]|nr:hypothetical protein [uncultured Mediterranean phage uvMED]
MKKRKLEIEVKCDYCGNYTSSFVSSYPDYKHFCRLQTPGYPPDKDCMTDFYQSKNSPSSRLINDKFGNIAPSLPTRNSKNETIKNKNVT